MIVDQNDCPLDDAALDRIAALKPAVHFLQFSGASYFPAAYDFPPERMKTEVEREATVVARRFFDAATRAGARHVVPSGGPPCFVDERGFELNFGGSIFFDADELLARAAREAPQLCDRLHPLYPGDVARADRAKTVATGASPAADRMTTSAAISPPTASCAAPCARATWPSGGPRRSRSTPRTSVPTCAISSSSRT